MKRHLLIYPCLWLIVLLSCSNGDDDIINDNMVESDTIIVNKRDTIIDDQDTIIIENDTKSKIGSIILDEDETIGFHIEKIVYWMKQVGGSHSKQGGDAFNGYLFQLQSGHSFVDIYDIKNKTLIATRDINFNGSYHCNNVDFSNTFYNPHDEFPLLYSSQQNRYVRCIIADRITQQTGDYMMETVQRIDLPFEDEVPLQYTPDAVIDKKNGFIYVYTGNTIPITDFYIYQFRLPSIEDGEVVKLKEEDIISKWVVKDNPAYYKQGGIMRDGVLITLEGMSDNKMRIIDLENHRYKLIDLKKDYGANWEPEDIFEIDDQLFLVSSGQGIYQVVLSNE